MANDERLGRGSALPGRFPDDAPDLSQGGWP